METGFQRSWELQRQKLNSLHIYNLAAQFLFSFFAPSLLKERSRIKQILFLTTSLSTRSLKYHSNKYVTTIQGSLSASRGYSGSWAPKLVSPSLPADHHVTGTVGRTSWTTRGGLARRLCRKQWAVHHSFRQSYWETYWERAGDGWGLWWVEPLLDCRAGLGRIFPRSWAILETILLRLRNKRYQRS